MGMEGGTKLEIMMVVGNNQSPCLIWYSLVIILIGIDIDCTTSECLKRRALTAEHMLFFFFKKWNIVLVGVRIL